MSESIIGKKFGKLTVIKDDGTRANPRAIKWLCKCDCGNTTHVVGNKLKTGHTKSCGCAKKEFDKWNYKDLSGQKFGRLTVIESDVIRDKKGRRRVMCECECGNYKEVDFYNLKCGKTRSCGCLNQEDSSELLKDKIHHEKMINSKKGKSLVEGTSLSSIKAKTQTNNKSGVRGVCYIKRDGVWKASLKFKGEWVLLKFFKNKQDAINARKEAEEKYYKPILEKYDTKKTDKHVRKSAD